MKKTVSSFVILAAILAQVLSGCQTQTPTPTAVPTPISSPTPRNDQLDQYLNQTGNLAPRLVETVPASGEDMALSGELSLTFDQPMDPDTTTKALLVSDGEQKPVAGSISWKNRRVLVFQPQKPLQTGAVYYAKLGATATSAQGKALDQAISLTFQTVGVLKVSQVFPADQVKDVENQAAITIMFNHPVVPLVSIEDQPRLPNPVQFEPEIKGKGDWINTSVYVFHPENLLTGGQTYRATIKAGLNDASGEAGTQLQEDYSWTFSVVSPGISSISMNDATLQNNMPKVPLNAVFNIGFRQPMDRQSVEDNLQLTSGGQAVASQTTWDEKSTQITIKPSELLKLNTGYMISLDAEARAVDGGSLSAGVQRAFTTVPYPSILNTRPANGSVNTASSFAIDFASPMDFKSLADRVVFSPPLDTKTHSWFNPSGPTLNFYDLEPSTRYTVSILPGMRDPFGNAIQTTTQVTFTTRALSPFAALVMPYDPVYRADGPQDFYLQYVNIASYDASVYRLTTDQVAEFINNNQKGTNDFSRFQKDKVWEQFEEPASKLNEVVLKDLKMSENGGKPLSTGFYFLNSYYLPTESAFYGNFRLFTVCTDSITVKVSPGQLVAWVTDLKTGSPTANAQVKIFDSNFTQTGEGQTDQNGLFQAKINTDPQENNNYKGGFQGEWYVLVDDSAHFGFASTYWGSGASPYSFGISEDFYHPWLGTTSYVYTERPLYRPGQPVYFKGIVRNDDDLLYSLPSEKQVEVVIRNYKEQIFQETLPLSEIGSFDGKFDLAQETALGSYTLEVRWPGSEIIFGSANFDVAEYRKPEFQMDVQAAPINVLPGDSFNVNLAASYYSGGGLSNAKVDWTLRSEPFYFNPPAEFNQFSFTDYEYDNWSIFNSQAAANAGKQIATGSGQTDATGKWSTSLKAEPAASSTSTTAPTSQSLIFEATVTDFAGTSVSGQVTTVMHKSAVYPGARAKSYVGEVGEDQFIDLVVLDWSGKPVPGAKVDIDIVERKWYSVQEEGDNGQLQWKTTVQEIPAAHFTGVQMDEFGRGAVSFKPSKGGIYRAKVTAHDEHENAASASAFLWVAGNDYIPWMQTNDRTFQLIADHDTYAPGDLAELLIASPFQGESYALLTIERGHVRQNEVLRLEGNSTLYHLSITADMAPDVYVSVLVVKGIDETNPRPNYKVGMARLKVMTTEQELKVDLKANPEQAGPGENVQYSVETTTLDGKPVQAEVSLALSDLAALSLKDSTVPPLLDFFYAPRSLSVITGISIIQSIEDYNANIADHLLANGQGAGSGGGKGSGYTGVIEIRQNFPDTAFWEAQVKTGADGKASVTVTLPDNLTTWRMDARAVTSDTRVGQATLDLISTRPLLVRPQTPRFFVNGDRTTLGAAVHNNTDHALSVTVKLEATGLDLNSPASQTIDIPAKEQHYVTWETSVPDGSQRVDLVFSAEGGGFKDATRPTLGTLDGQGIPVYRYEAPETVGTSGVLSDNGGRVETISLPSSMVVQKGQLNVEVAPSLAAGMTDGLTYLQSYPYECIEQTISRFLPNVRLSQALKAAGVQDTKLQENLKTQVNLGLQKLYNSQNPDGGWGWWSGMDSDVLTTAYVVLGLAEAHNAGYGVDLQILSHAASYLRLHLKTFADLPAANELNRQAFVLYVLNRAGYLEVSKTVQLYDHRQEMAYYARAYLLQTLHAINPNDERLKTLVSDLNSAAILSAAGTHWEEKTQDDWNWNTDIRSTAIVLGALIETDPQNGLNTNAVRWLMVNRKNGRWNSTQETAWTLLALTDWVTATGELNPDYQYAVGFNGTELTQGEANPQTLREVKSVSVDVTKMLSEEANRLVFARDGSSGSLYYTAYLNLWLPVNQIQPLDKGVTITRQYFKPEDLSQPVTEAGQGDVLLVRLTVAAPADLRYLIVEDPLPAGMEAVDTSLNSSPKAQQPDTYDWKRVETDGWGWWYFTHSELRDEKVVLSTDYLPKGTYVYTYLARASTPGTFNVIPPTAQEFYFPDVYGRGSGSQFVIAP
jgi:uncharacterized protein YfaS (alpha-2-macroglobulin family)